VFHVKHDFKGGPVRTAAAMSRSASRLA
jgi:hypothetical protein